MWITCGEHSYRVVCNFNTNAELTQIVKNIPNITIYVSIIHDLFLLLSLLLFQGILLKFQFYLFIYSVLLNQLCNSFLLCNSGLLYISFFLRQ